MAEAHQLKCLEVWGGTEAVERTIDVPGIDAWVYSKPYADSVAGGDIHYVSSCFTGRVARFTVADVCGHGSGVSHLSGRLKTLMRKHINHLDQTGLARVLNKEFGAASGDFKFATAVLVSYFAPSDHLVVCNAGHPPPLWYRASEGEWKWLDHELPDCTESPTNLPLGMIDPTEYVQFSVRLGQDDILMLYTDSMIEAMDASTGQQIGQAGLLDLVQKLAIGTPESMGRALLDLVTQVRGPEAPADDDQTLVVMHHNASEVPSRPFRGAIRAMASLLGLAGD